METAKRDTAIRKAFETKSDRAKELLLKHDILGEFGAALLKKAPKLADERYAFGLRFLKARQQSWERPLEDWKPKGKAADTQFRSLVRHLIVKYSVPQFLYSVFWDDTDGLRHRGSFLFYYLAQGGSLRKAVKPDFSYELRGEWVHAYRPLLPVPLTKRMCHTFTQSTSEHTLVSAVRHAQIEAFGGGQRVAERVCATHLGRDLAGGSLAEEFWQSVLQWVCNQTMLDPARIGNIVDWVRHRRMEDANTFSMKGRTAVSVLREVERWHTDLAAQRDALKGIYESSGIKPYRGVRKVRLPTGADHKEIWTITEILNGKELREEGRAHRHCVVSYARSIEDGGTSIWSLQVDGVRRVTIEVNNRTRQIVQAAGKFNRRATPVEKKTIDQWVAKNGLAKNKWLRW